jgi:hypothetical protein
MEMIYRDAAENDLVEVRTDALRGDLRHRFPTGYSTVLQGPEGTLPDIYPAADLPPTLARQRIGK